MSEENEPTEELDGQEKNEPKIDYDKFSKLASEKIEEKLSGHFGKFEQKIESLRNKKQENEDDDDAIDADGLEDDEIITRKDLKEVLKSLEEKVEKTVDGTLKKVSVKGSRDNQAFEDFPMLNGKSSLYSKEFTDAVMDEIDRRVESGRDRDKDPDLLYDAAASVFAGNKKFRSLNIDSAKEEARRMNNMESSFNISGGKNKKTNVPSADQMEIAKKLNLDPEVLKNQFKKRHLGG